MFVHKDVVANTKTCRWQCCDEGNVCDVLVCGSWPIAALQRFWKASSALSSSSFLELAACSYIAGLHFVSRDGDVESLALAVSVLRAISSAAAKRGTPLFPVPAVPAASKCNGRRHPNRILHGARLLTPNEALLMLARTFQRVARQSRVGVFSAPRPCRCVSPLSVTAQQACHCAETFQVGGE